MSNPIKVLVERLPHAPEELPQYATPGSAGLDLKAALDTPVVLMPLERRLIPTGLKMAIPQGYEAQIRARSGLSIKHGITLVNAVGTIDSDYRNEVMVPVINLSSEAYTIEPGERIAQLLLAPVWHLDWEVCDTLPETKELVRTGGFGSTGK